MEIRIEAPTVEFLKMYTEVPISFEVNKQFEIVKNTHEFYGINLKLSVTDPPYIKNFDYIESEQPTHWNEKWDLSNWGFFGAYIENQLIGGCAVAWNTDKCSMLNNRIDMCVLWDIRIHQDYRYQGIGTKLFEAVIRFGKERGCKLLKIEAQNNNVAACRFYKRMGCYLGGFNMHAYQKFPDETMLLWYYEILPS